MIKTLLVLALILVNFTANAQNTFRQPFPKNIFDQTIATSCLDHLNTNPLAKSGMYYVFPNGMVNGGNEVYCDMEADGGGWTRIANYSAAKSGCNENFALSNESYICLKQTREETQTFSNMGIKYQEVRGNTVLFQYASTDGFRRINSGSTIDNLYADGMSFYYNDSSMVKQHIYTYAIGINTAGNSYACPQIGGDSAPSFVGTNFKCETGNNTSDWDVKLYNTPLFKNNFFTADLGQEVNKPIHARLMTDQYIDDESIALSSVTIFVR